jgi:ribosomal subunit interface protein
MTLQVTGKNLDVGEALRSYVVDKIEQALDKYVGSSLSGHIRVEKNRGTFRTDCSIQLRSGLVLQSHGEANEAYASADLAVERLDKRLRRHKRRLKSHHGATAAAAAQTQAPDYVIRSGGQEEEEEPEGENPVIIAETQMVISELAVSDAVMQMDLSDTSFLVFRNAGHGRINVVYRRPDGNIGWIDPGGDLPNG